jgi:O-antigen/teichoic acid export membrane protein
MKKHIIAEGLWVSLGQGMAALGTLVGIRLLTEFLSPEIFGAVSLLIGVGALVLGVCCTPWMQAALRYYPERAAAGQVHVLRRAVTNGMRNSVVFGIAALVLMGIVYSASFGESFTVPLLLAGLVLVDIVRTVETTFFNAARRQKPYALWTAAEAWMRPLLALVAVLLFGMTTDSVMAGYLLASLALLVVMFNGAEREGMTDRHSAVEFDDEMRRSIWKYALPLVPLAVIAWITGLSGRYIIGGFLGLKEAGIYAAAYGLVSRPFLMLGHVVELTLRPLYQNAVSHHNHGHARKILSAWMALLTVTAGVGLTAIILWHDQIAALLLGEQYRSGAKLLPWIAGGYYLLIVSYVYERVCYAYGKTRYVLVIQVFGGVTCLAITTFAVMYWGLYGAVVAIPIYFGIQLLISMVLAMSISREMSQRKHDTENIREIIDPPV